MNGVSAHGTNSITEQNNTTPRKPLQYSWQQILVWVVTTVLLFLYIFIFMDLHLVQSLVNCYLSTVDSEDFTLELHICHNNHPVFREYNGCQSSKNSCQESLLL